MAYFRSLTADRRPLEEFKGKVPKPVAGKGDKSSPHIPLHVFEWSQNIPDGVEISGITSVEELESRSQGEVRVMLVPRDLSQVHANEDSFAPQDVPLPETVEGFSELFEKCRIPSAFVDESVQGVSQSFAAQKDVDGTIYVWFHFLCKDLAISNNKIVHVQNPEETNDSKKKKRLEAQGQSQANFTWLKPGFVLKIRDQRGSSPKPNRTTTSSSDSTITVASAQAKVELFCFGAPVPLGDRFRKLKNIAAYEDILQNPYVFLEIVLEEMYKIMDRTGWAVSDVFGAIETVGSVSFLY